MGEPSSGALVRGIIDDNQYMVLATADDAGIEVFSRRSLAHDGVAWTPEDVGEATGIRLYRARAAEHSILAKDGQPDHRIPADPES